MDVISVIDRLSKAGKSPEQLAKEISVLEAGFLWQILYSKYSFIRRVQLYHELVADTDFKLVLGHCLKVLQEEADTLEQNCKNYSVAITNKPPVFVQVNTKIDAINDKYIFEQLYERIKGFATISMSAYILSRSIEMRNIFLLHLEKELDLYDNCTDYGLMKGFMEKPPFYRP